MKKSILIATVMTLLLGFSDQSMAGTHVSVNISPPVFVFPAPPEVVVIPETYVYYDPDVDFDIFFCGGHWYRPHGGYWYSSASYNGPWVHMQNAPSFLLGLPPTFRIIVRGERRIPFVELHRNWRAWERERYWEHQNWGRSEHMRHYGLSPSFREREHRRGQGVAPQFRERGHGGNDGGVHGGGGFHGGGRHEGDERR